MEDWLDLHPDPAHVRREREKARELRRTPWWRAQIAKGVCHYCGQHVGPENLTLDHVVPYMKTVCESYAPADLVRQLSVLLGGVAVYALVTYLAFRTSAARFEQVDL